MTDVEEPLRPGKERVTIRLVELASVKNPELVGDAEWELRLWVNGLERWKSEGLLRMKEGEAVPIGEEIHVDIFDTSEEVTVEVKAIEKDLLNPDDHASGSVVLHRVQGFGSVAGETVEIRGPAAHLELKLAIEVSA